MIKKLRQFIKQFLIIAYRVNIFEACFELWNRLLRRLTYRQRCYRLWDGSAYPLCCRYDTSDYSVFKQIFIDGGYDCLRDVKSPRLIVDCGANVGYSAAYFFSCFSDAHVVAIEPDFENFKICKRNLKFYKKRISLYHSAVWSSSRSLKVIRGKFRDGADWSVQVRTCSNAETTNVHGINLADLLKKSGFEYIDILKIDIEGAEKEIFTHNYKSWLPWVRNIAIELHDKECEDAFLKAMSLYNYKLSHSGELTVCRNIVPKKLTVRP